MQRVYSKDYHRTHPTYTNATVCKDWLVFSNFKKWMETQNWQGKELDKDILVEGNEEYSPKTCCFVTKELNLLLNGYRRKIRKYPKGVRKTGTKFVATISICGKTKYLGSFKTSEKANIAYQKARNEYLLNLTENSNLEDRIKKALLKRIKP